MEPRSGTFALDKSLDLLRVIASDRGETPIGKLAARLDLPASTARRLLAALGRHGLVARVGHGRYLAGHGLVTLAGFADTKTLLAHAARPILRSLADTVGATAHLGVLEGEMVTYVVKEHGGDGPLFTSERDQLEAYCSGVGKILLAALDDAALEAYLAGGGFVALTDRTIVDPAGLRAELMAVRRRGHAVDNGEVAEGLYCVATALTDPAGRVVAALSVSGEEARLRAQPSAALIGRLEAGAAAIGRRLWPRETMDPSSR